MLGPKIRQTVHKLFKSDPELQLRDAPAEAKMRSVSKSQMARRRRICKTGNIEFTSIAPYLLVSVCRIIPDHDLVTLFDDFVGKFDIPHSRPADVHERR